MRTVKCALSILFGIIIAGLVAIAGGATLAIIIIAGLFTVAFDSLVWND